MVHSASVPPSSREVELAIVGAGPVGLYAAYYAGFRGLRTVVLETLPLVGGQIATFYPESVIFDVPGFPAVTGSELVARLLAQMESFPVELRLGEEVVALARRDERILMRTERGGAAGAPASNEYLASAVLVAAGIGSFSPQRLRVAAIAAYEGRGLQYDPPPPASVAGARVFVLGGSDRAVAVALALADHAAGVTLVHRRDRLAVGDELRRTLEASKVRFLPFYELAALSGTQRVEAVELVERRGGGRRTEPADLVVPCFGFHADARSLARFGVRLESGAILVDSRMASTEPGIYAAGDGATYPGKVRVLASEFGEACTAVNNIAARVVTGAHVFPGYSSHRKGAPRRGD